MGFFSSNCEGCSHPALCAEATNPTNAWMVDVVTIDEGGKMCAGQYDGYGNVGEVTEALGFGQTVWHRACWEAAGTPENYRGEKCADDQGWFFDDGEHDMVAPTVNSSVDKPDVEQWEVAGEVGVDSGQLLITDPCYVDSEWEPNTAPSGHPTCVLTEAGMALWPELHLWEWTFGHDLTLDGTAQTYADSLDQLGGMSINDAFEAGLVTTIARPVVRDYSYRGACSVSGGDGEMFGQLHYAGGQPGAGVAVSSGYGDGVYPVLVRRNEDGRVAEIRIVLIEN